MPLTSVPGQVSAGPIDGYLRSDAGDGTLGLPDCSLIPYTYAPLLGVADSVPSWSVDQFRQTAFAAFKGSPDGFGALRFTGGARGSVAIEVIPAASGVRTASPDGSRGPEFTWGPRDFAFAVRHSGAASWSSASPPCTYVTLTQATNTIGIRQTVPASALGPWDAELADSAAIPLTGLVNVWDGGQHTFYIATYGQNVFCLIDGVVGFPFRAPRAYKRNANGSTDTNVSSTMSSAGGYMGYDCRGAENSLWSWSALQPGSGDFFFHDMGATAVQTAPSTTSTPTTTSSGETWTVTGTATASKNGILLAANSAASFNVDQPYGVLCTRWGTATAEGGLVWRRKDTNNYYMVTSTGIWSCIAGALNKIHTFTVPLTAGNHIAVKNWADRIRVYVNGVSVASYPVTPTTTGKGVGFRSPAAGTSEFRYIAYQPMVSDPILPTT